MTAFIDENQQFIDPDTSAPIVNGNVFFGEQGADPESVPITVFVDRELTTPIAQPVKTDASGRTTQKIFIPGRYSFKVTNSAGSQKLIDLDAGTSEAIGTAVLTNIAGANNITANADPVITALIDGTQFTFTAVAVNTTNMTLNIDGTGAKSILFNFAEQMAPGFIRQDQIVNITYNLIRDNFVWNNEGRGTSLLTSIGGTANAITAVGGPSITTNYVDQQQYSFKPAVDNTGAVTLQIGALPTVSIKNKGVELSAGQLIADIIYIVSFDLIGNVFELVSGLPLASPGPIGETNANTIDFTTLQGNTAPSTPIGNAIDRFDNGSIATNSSTRGVTQAAVNSFGTSVNQASQAEMESAASLTKTVSPGRTKNHPGVAKAWVNFNGTGTPSIRSDYNIDSITDLAIGRYIINITDNFSSVNYVVSVTPGMFGTGNVNATGSVENQAGLSAGSAQIQTGNTGGSNGLGTKEDFDYVGVIFLGDQ